MNTELYSILSNYHKRFKTLILLVHTDEDNSAVKYGIKSVILINVKWRQCYTHIENINILLTLLHMLAFGHVPAITGSQPAWLVCTMYTWKWSCLNTWLMGLNPYRITNFRLPICSPVWGSPDPGGTCNWVRIAFPDPPEWPVLIEPGSSFH